MDSLRVDTGIPRGLRISIGGNVRIGSALGGSVDIDFETFNLLPEEAFVMFIDSEEVLREEAGLDVKHGYSIQKNQIRSFPLEKGDHLIQFSVESRIQEEAIASYWDTHIYDDNADILQSRAEVAINRITIKGGIHGGAYEC